MVGIGYYASSQLNNPVIKTYRRPDMDLIGGHGEKRVWTLAGRHVDSELGKLLLHLAITAISLHVGHPRDF